MLLSDSGCSHWLHRRTTPQGQEKHTPVDFENSKYFAVQQKIQDASSGTKRNLNRAWVLAAQRQEDKSYGTQKFKQTLALSIINPRISWSSQEERDEHIQPSTSFPFHSRTNSRDSNQTCDILMNTSVSFSLEYPQEKWTWHFESEVYSGLCTLKTVAAPHCHSAPVQTYYYSTDHLIIAKILL